MHYYLRNALRAIVVRTDQRAIVAQTQTERERLHTTARAARLWLLHDGDNAMIEKWIDEHDHNQESE